MMDFNELNQELNRKLMFQQLDKTTYEARDAEAGKSLRLDISPLVANQKEGFNNHYFKNTGKFFSFRLAEDGLISEPGIGYYLNGFYEFAHSPVAKDVVFRINETLHREFGGCVQIHPHLPSTGIYKLVQLTWGEEPTDGSTLKIAGVSRANYRAVADLIERLMEDDLKGKNRETQAFPSPTEARHGFRSWVKGLKMGWHTAIDHCRHNRATRFLATHHIKDWLYIL